MSIKIAGIPDLPSAERKTKGERGWLPVFQSFISELRVQSKEVAATDERGSKLNLWGSQRMYLQHVCDGMDDGVRQFFCLKSRQLGITTVSLAIDLFWLAVHPRMLGVLVADNDDNRNFFRKTLQNYYKSLPPEFTGADFEKIKDNEGYMEWSNGSRLDFLVAGSRKKTWGEGRGYTMAHLCMAKGTPVVVENGRIKNIEDVLIGEKLLTHTGQVAKVIDCFGQSGVGKRIIKIQPWLGEAIRYTEWHKIPTQRGLVQAKDIRKDDLLIMPVRKITGIEHSVILPESKGIGGVRYKDKYGKFVSGGTQDSVRMDRDNWINRDVAGSGKKIILNKEVGFAIGYYLAEGCIIHNSLGKPCGITFCRHRSEGEYADRAIKALSPFITKNRRTTDREDSFSTSETIYGTILAEWIAETFGVTNEKFIPDEVFGWGRSFCEGLLVGLLSGDGSKTTVVSNDKYPTNTVVLPTTRSSIAMQARDIAASIGIGWATIKFKDGGNHYGRNCKPCWRITWNGEAASIIRGMMGLSQIPRQGHSYTNKYILEDDRVLIKIRGIEECQEEEEIWDISVDHDDHTFRTPYMSTSNTEIAKYGTPEGISSFWETLAETHPDRLVMVESTAFGYNHWKTMFEGAKKEIYTKKAFFIGWWSKEINSISMKDRRFKLYGEPPDQYEMDKIRLVKDRYGVTISPEQLAWRRERDADDAKSREDNDQNQPWFEEEAFVQSGFSFFQTRLCSKLLDYICDPVNEIEYKAYRFELGNQFTNSHMYPVLQEELERKGTDIIELRVWSEPVEGATYVIGCDPAYGRNDWKDRHAVSVWRCFSDKLVQVAEYADNRVETHQAAWVLAYLAGVYKDCILNIELTGPGRAVFKELDDKRQEYRAEVNRKIAEDRDWDNFLGSARYYLYHRPDALGAGYAYHTELTWSVKGRVLNQFRDSFTTGVLDIKSAPLVEEMMNVIQDGSEIAAPGTLKDDRVFAAMYAHMAYKDWVQAGMIQNGQAYAAVMESEDLSASPASNMVRHIVMNFWKTRTELLENPPKDVPTFYEERGL